MDSIHCYIFHIFDIGLRTLSTTPPHGKNYDEKSNGDKMTTTATQENEFFDSKFAEIRQRINDTRGNTQTLKRFESRDKNSKFSINIQYQDNTITRESNCNLEQEPGSTFIDSIFTHLQNMNLNERSISNLKFFINSEDFDTESISMDVIDGENGAQGNISKAVQDNQCMAAINKLLALSLSMLYVSLPRLYF